MIWKPKEKEYTLEEAIIIAKKELAPYWCGSPPLIAGVRQEGRSIAVPLNSEFSKQAWFILFLDPTAFGGESSFSFLKEWTRRYNVNELNFLAIYTSVYSYIKNLDVLQRLKDRHQVDFPWVVDADGVISEAFGVEQFPKVLLQNQGEIFLDQCGVDWLDGTELKIQKFLRSRDPGLPLLTVFEPPSGMPMSKDTGRIEFGFRTKWGDQATFFPAGFVPVKEGDRVAEFTTNKPESLEIGTIYIKGKWKQDQERITTEDPEAMIAFKCKSNRVSLVAQSITKRIDSAVILVELNQAPVREAILGDHMSLDDLGRSLIKVSYPQLYHVLIGLKDELIEVTLRFPNAQAIPVALYGLRFGD